MCVKQKLKDDFFGVVVHVLQKIKPHEHHGLFQPQKSMNDSRSHAGAPNIHNLSGYAWITQSPFISGPPCPH